MGFWKNLFSCGSSNTQESKKLVFKNAIGAFEYAHKFMSIPIQEGVLPNGMVGFTTYGLTGNGQKVLVIDNDNSLVECTSVDDTAPGRFVLIGKMTQVPGGLSNYVKIMDEFSLGLSMDFGFLPK